MTEHNTTQSTVIDDILIEYVAQNNGKLDMVDIVHHFGGRADIIGVVITRLADVGKINRVWNGRSYVYTAER